MSKKRTQIPKIFTNCDPLIKNTLSNKLKWKYIYNSYDKAIVETINTNPHAAVTRLGSRPNAYILEWKGREHYLSPNKGAALFNAINTSHLMNTAKTQNTTSKTQSKSPSKPQSKQITPKPPRPQERIIAPNEDVELVSTVVKVTSAIVACENNNHTILDVTGIIDVMNQYCKVSRIGIPLHYCENCKKYYMYKSDFIWARKHGILMCHLKQNIQSYNVGNFVLRERSILKEYGYDVSKTSNYSSQYRQSLLQYLMDYNVVSKRKILNLLEFNISSHEGNMNFSDACYKWNQDRNYVVNYHKNDSKQYSVKIDEIIYKLPRR